MNKNIVYITCKLYEGEFANISRFMLRNEI